MCICVFKRYELKYVLNPAQYEAVLARAAARLRPDEYGANGDTKPILRHR